MARIALISSPAVIKHRPFKEKVKPGADGTSERTLVLSWPQQDLQTHRESPLRAATQDQNHRDQRAGACITLRLGQR